MSSNSLRIRDEDSPKRYFGSDLPRVKRRKRNMASAQCTLVYKANKKGVTFTGKLHSNKCLTGLNKLRLNGQFCDFTLKVEETSIPCHKGILAVNSDYFNAMFTVGLVESKADEIHLDNVDAKALECIINFMYTGSLAVEKDSVQDILFLADMLQMSQLKEICAEYMESQIDVSNCLALYQLASQLHCNSLQDKCQQLIKQRFTFISSVAEFSQLPLETVCDILSWNDLALDPKGEDCVMEAVMAWLKHDFEERKTNITHLFQYVRLHHVSQSLLKEMIDSFQDEELKNQIAVNLQNTDAGVRVAKQYLYVIGGFLQSRTGPQCPRHKSAVRMNTNTGQWEPIADLPMAGSGVITFSVHKRIVTFLFEWRHMEMVGDVREYMAALEYDPVQNEWSDITEQCEPAMEAMFLCASKGGATVVCQTSHKVYVMDKNNLHVFRFQQVEGDLCIPKDSHQIFSIPPEIMSLQNFKDFSLAVCSGGLYCCGGANHKADFEFEPMNTVFRFDVVDEIWTQKSSMPEKRAKMALVEYSGKLFAIGGYNGVRLQTGDVYDVTTDAWTPIAPMRRHRTHFSACVCTDRIYVMGGKSYNYNNTQTPMSPMMGGPVPRKVLKYAEIYDPKTNSWEDGEVMPQARCMYGAAVL